MANITRCNSPDNPGTAIPIGVSSVAASIAITSILRANFRFLSRCKKRATTPIANAKPITVAVIECNRSSMLSVGMPASQGLCENAAVPSIHTANTSCIQNTASAQKRLRYIVSHKTARPKQTNPSRAIHAYCRPCAADSLMECDNHEYPGGIANGAR